MRLVLHHHSALSREVFLDPDAGSHTRNLFTDFLTIPDFNPTSVEIVQIGLGVDAPGFAIIDNIVIE